MSIETPPLDRKLAAILAADVEGYSRLMHDDEEGALAMLSAHRIVIDARIAEAGGRITSTAGDSVLAEFASVVEAVDCAVAIQKALAVANDAFASERQMHFRIGINVGDVMVKDGGIFGDGVNVAARVEALAPPGGICVTRGVRDHVRDRVPHRFEDLGGHTVKNISRPVHVFQVMFDEDGRTDRKPPAKASPAVVSSSAGGRAADEDAETIFWKAVETGDTPEEYQAYIDRYPEGTFAVLARARIEAGQADAAEAPADPAIELAFWDSVKDSDDRAMLQAYLDKYPDGEFRSLAELQIASLEKP